MKEYMGYLVPIPDEMWEDGIIERYRSAESSADRIPYQQYLKILKDRQPVRGKGDYDMWKEVGYDSVLHA